MRARWLPVLFAATAPVALFVACSPYSPNLGKEPFLCGTGSPACPDGYTCMNDGTEMVCVENSGGGGGGGDGGGSGSCADDSEVEGPNGNNTIANAYQVQVITNFDFTGLAICPAGDVDYYEVNLPTMESLDVTVIYAQWGGALQASIQTPSGTVVQQLMPESGMDRTIHAFAQNLNSGPWYVEVAGPTAGTPENNYELKINAGAQ
ncbi:MAG TPA: hypothetical protein VMJ10_33700 [Kofleriaceae bacterium]|nr:hypothetical protein [Kofleriaceae bacterium]